MADQNSIDFRVRVTDEGLPQLDQNIKQVDASTEALAESAAEAGQQLEELGQAAEASSAGTEELARESDAVADAMDEMAAAARRKTDALKTALDVERSEITLARSTLELQRTQAQGALQAARAKGDEAAATQALNRLRQVEVDQLALTARAKRAEAAAVQAAADARREQLAAVGPLTQAQRAELTAAENTAKALRTEAAAADEAARNVRGLGKDLQDTAAAGPQLDTALSAVGKAVAGLFAVSKAKDFALDTIALADAYGQMAERIAMATPVASEYDRVQERILATANLTYRRLEEQQELYIRTADSLRSMGYETEQALDIQDSFSFLLTTNAASAERGKNAIDAYTKAIQSGKVEVDGWGSMMAAMPTLVDAVAKATGKTAAEVRALGVTGKLSITDINEGLRQTVELNKEAAAGMSATVADAVTRLTNTWTTYIGEANRANQSTEKIVGAIDMLSENLDTVINLAITAGEVMAVAWGLKAMGALKAYTAQLTIAAAETTALMTATAAGAAKAGAAIAAAGQLGLAAWAGWEVGTFLKSEFEAVERAGIAMAAGIHRAAIQFQGAWEAAVAVFSSDTIEAALERTRQKLAEVDDEYAALFAAVGKVDEGQKKVAASTEQASQAAGNATTEWTRLRQSYGEVNTELEKQDALLQKSVIMKNAEASAAAAVAQAFGTERQARDAQVQVATVEAEQLRRVAEQRALEVSVLQAEAAALREVGAEMLAADPAKTKELADLEQKIALKQADAGAAMAQAQASQVAAAQAQAEADAMADNSKRVNELRDARDRASAALERATRLHAEGKITTDQLTQAQIAAGRAAMMYRDAINDQAAALAAKARVQQAEFSLQESGLRLLIEQQRGIAEVARARGDESTAMRAQNEIRQLEIQLMELQAAAKRAEAEAQVKAVEAKRAELLAQGPLTEAKKAELDAMLKMAEVRRMEADIAQTTANKMRDLANATREGGKAARDARGGYDDAADGLNRMADASERAAEAERKRLGVDKDGFSTDKSGNRIAMGGDLNTLTGIANFLKSAGLDDAQAKRVATEFSDGKGNIPYFSNPGQTRYGGDTISMALLRAAERITFGVGNGGAGGAPINAGPTKTVNVNLPVGNGRRKTATMDEESAAAVVKSMEYARSRS